jgi:hypothetical protein
MPRSHPPYAPKFRRQMWIWCGRGGARGPIADPGPGPFDMSVVTAMVR